MAQTYTQIQQQIAALQAQAEGLKRSELGAVLAKVKETIAKYGLTAKDLFGTKAAKPAKPGVSPSKDAKYADGKGNVWVGRGPRPLWLRNALASGASIDSFKVGKAGAKAAEAPSAAPAGKAAAKKGAATNGVKGKRVKAKYRDGTGNSWSGRGSQPRWLKAAVTGGKKLEDFAI